MMRSLLPVLYRGWSPLLAVSVAVGAAWPAHADPPDENRSWPAGMPGPHERPAYLQEGYRPAGYVMVERPGPLYGRIDEPRRFPGQRNEPWSGSQEDVSVIEPAQRGRIRVLLPISAQSGSGWVGAYIDSGRLARPLITVATALKLSPAEPDGADPTITLDAGTPVRVTGSRKTKLLQVIAESDTLRVTGHVPAALVGDMAQAPGRPDDREVTGEPRTVPDGTIVRATPGGKALARIQSRSPRASRDRVHRVLVHEARDGHMKIEYRDGGITLHGWVPASALSTPPGVVGGVIGDVVGGVVGGAGQRETLLYDGREGAIIGQILFAADAAVGAIGAGSDPWSTLKVQTSLGPITVWLRTDHILTRRPPPEPTPTAPEPPEPSVVPSGEIEASRIAGQSQIVPDKATKIRMKEAGTSRVMAIVMMCLSTTGDVSTLKVIRSSGYEEYDQKILSAMQKWKYSPYRDNGKPVPVCSPITFIYSQK